MGEDIYSRSSGIKSGNGRSVHSGVVVATAPSRTAHFSPAIKQTLCSQPPSSQPPAERFGDFGDSVLLVRGLLTADICERILRDSEHWPWVAADMRGMSPGDDAGDIFTEIDDGSLVAEYYSVTAYDEAVARALWARLEPVVPPERVAIGNDDEQHGLWRPVGLNPAFRVIRSESHSSVTVPHYDMSLNFADSNRRTLMSVLFTLTPQNTGVEQGGQGLNTRFLLDTQRWMPPDERDFSDHAKPASPKDVLTQVSTDLGDCLLFDHEILHDFAIWAGSPRSQVVMRTDIIYERSALHDTALVARATKMNDGISPSPGRAYRKALAAFSGSSPRLWTGPVDKLLSRLAQLGSDSSKELAVLVTTGSFCPIHKGHIQMMESARRELEARGVAVLGGYFCPDHDEHISAKFRSGGGINSLSSSQRLYLCEQAIADSSWLMVDRWAASYAPWAVYFGRILDHISQMVAHNVRTHRQINVIYVFGSDHAAFAFDFVDLGSCVCVLREGSVDNAEYVSIWPEMRGNSQKVIFSSHINPAISSTGIRRGDTSGLPDSIKAEWNRLQSAQTQAFGSESMSFYIREEGVWAIEPWAGCNPKKTAMAYRSFTTGLRQVFAKAFAREPRMLPKVNIVPIQLQDQERVYREYLDNQRVISLDPCLPGNINLQISLLFRPHSMEEYGFVAGYRAPSLASQISRIDPGNYVLFGDGKFNGRTANYVMGLLAGRCTIDSFQTFCDDRGPVDLDIYNQAMSSGELLNVVDCRDFLAGAREGGLCLELPDGFICRAPYTLPYVRPYHHASVPIEAEVDFSADIWALNRNFFASLDVELCLEDMSPAFQELCDSLKFPANMTMVDFCAWHLDELQ